METLEEILHLPRYADGDPRRKPQPYTGPTGGGVERVSTLDQIFNGTGIPERVTLMNELLNPMVNMRDAGDGSRNYVVFDENLIEIVRKYGIAGAAAMLGVSAADLQASMQPQSMRDVLQ